MISLLETVVSISPFLSIDVLSPSGVAIVKSVLSISAQKRKLLAASASEKMVLLRLKILWLQLGS